MEIYATKYAIIGTNLQCILCNAFYMQNATHFTSICKKYMQKYVKTRTVIAKTCRNMQEICKKYAFVYALICKKNGVQKCINMQIYMLNIKVYVLHMALIDTLPTLLMY